MGNSFSMLMDGFQTAFTATNLMFGLLGTFLGTLVGVLPGIGPALAIGLLLPICLTVKQIGSKSPIASAGPIPGKTPTSVPRNVPSKPNIKFVAVKAVWKPSINIEKLLPISEDPLKET